MSVCEEQINWVWYDIARLNAKFFKIINQEFIQKPDIVKLPL